MKLDFMNNIMHSESSQMRGHAEDMTDGRTKYKRNENVREGKDELWLNKF